MAHLSVINAWDDEVGELKVQGQVGTWSEALFQNKNKIANQKEKNYDVQV